MSGSCRSWWRNCASTTDDEMSFIDKMEDEIAPLKPNISQIRQLIGSFELCHHKADRWIANILAAIASGKTSKGLGTRPAGQFHEAENLWQGVCLTLQDWIDGKLDLSEYCNCIGSISKAQLVSGIGKRSALKIWQVERVIQKIGSLIYWPRNYEDSEKKYEWLMLNARDYEADFLESCPACYEDQKAFWLTTAQTMIQDTLDGSETQLSLALAIDMLWPCHWNFLENLLIVLNAIGGDLTPAQPFAACGRNIHLFNRQDKLQSIRSTLRVYLGNPEVPEEEVDKSVLEKLGEPTQEKCWLVASLEKTIRLQLNPPTEMREASSMVLPDSHPLVETKSEISI